MDILYSFTRNFFVNFGEDVWDGRETHYSYSLFWCDLCTEDLRSRRKCKTLKNWLCKREICIHV